MSHSQIVKRMRLQAGYLGMLTLAVTALTPQSAKANWWQEKVEKPFRRWCDGQEWCRNTAENVCRLSCDKGRDQCLAEALPDCSGIHERCWVSCLRESSDAVPEPKICDVQTAHTGVDGTPHDLLHIRVNTVGDLVVHQHHATGGGAFARAPTYKPGVHVHGGEPQLFGVRSVDFTGDGITDLLHYRPNSGELMFFPHIGDGAGGYTRAPNYHAGVHPDGGEDTLTKLMAGDRDGDGLVDFSHVRTDDSGQVIMINHFSDGAGGFITAPTFRTQTHYSGGENTLIRMLSGDTDGDGRNDLIHVRTDDGGKLVFINYLANGFDGFIKLPTYRTQTHYNGGENTYFTVIPGDFDGNGLTDLSQVRTDGGGTLIFITYLADGLGGFTQLPTYNTGTHYSGGEATFVAVVPADLNSDGVTDLVHARTNDHKLIFLPYLGDGSGRFIKAPQHKTDDHYSGGEATIVDVIASDVSGDGLEDLLHVRTNSGDLIIKPHLGNGAGWFTIAPTYRTGVAFAK